MQGLKVRDSVPELVRRRNPRNDALRIPLPWPIRESPVQREIPELSFHGVGARRQEVSPHSEGHLRDDVIMGAGPPSLASHLQRLSNSELHLRAWDRLEHQGVRLKKPIGRSCKTLVPHSHLAVERVAKHEFEDVYRLHRSTRGCNIPAKKFVGEQLVTVRVSEEASESSVRYQRSRDSRDVRHGGTISVQALDGMPDRCFHKRGPAKAEAPFPLPRFFALRP